MNDTLKRSSAMIIVALIIGLSVLSTSHMIGLGAAMASSQSQDETNQDLFGKSDISVLAFQNVTFIPTNNTVDLGVSQISPTDLTVRVVDGFKPQERFEFQFDPKLERQSNSQNNTLELVDDGLQVSFSAVSRMDASISVHRLTLRDKLNLSRNDYLSLAISTPDTYNSTEAYVGIALSLKDSQNATFYVYLHVSNLFTKNSYVVSKYFLGSARYVNAYPSYEFRYGSFAGPWFVQLSLLDAFSDLNLDSALLDSVLVGGELYSSSLYLNKPYNITQADIKFNYLLACSQPFSINENIVNSTQVTLPSTRFLNISGIQTTRLPTTIRGSLRPNYITEEEQENGTVKVVEVAYNFSETPFYNFSAPLISEPPRSAGDVNITVWAKTVQSCTLTLDNDTTIDLTDSVLTSNQGIIYRFPSATRVLKVSLIFYRFNAWIFDLAYTALRAVTKKGIVEEYFLPEENEGVVTIDFNELGEQEANLAIRGGNISFGEISVNGVKKPIGSLIVLRTDRFLVASLKAEGGTSLYTIRYSFYSDPLYFRSPVNPFSLLIGNSLFEIYTPFEVEAPLGTQVPITIKVFTTKTYIVKVEYDSLMFEIDKDFLMVNKITGFEYFMLKPKYSGFAWINVHIIDPSAENSPVSIPLLVNVTNSIAYEIVPYVLGVIAVLSFFSIAGSRNSLGVLSRRFRRKQPQL